MQIKIIISAGNLFDNSLDNRVKDDKDGNCFTLKHYTRTKQLHLFMFDM